MSKIQKFEDIQAWRNSQDLVNWVYKITGEGKFKKDFALRDQMRRAAISVPSNIAEGFARNSKKEFVQFLFIAKGSAAEVQSQLYTARSQSYITENEFNQAYESLETISKQLSKFITYLKKAG